MALSAEENLAVKKAELQKRDILRELSGIALAVKKTEEELSQLKEKEIEAKRVLGELNKFLEGKEYKGNT